jgi:coenzyme PQQ precursor peptide PqqA
LPLSGLSPIYDAEQLGWRPTVVRIPKEELIMKTWMKPSVREQEVGLEVTSYMPAEIDLI